MPTPGPVPPRALSAAAAEALLVGLVAGSVASFVKWGVEVPLPPRPAHQPSPPDEMLRSFGVPVDRLYYRWSGRTLNWAGAATHQGFSLVFAALYAFLAERHPRVRRAYGTGYGLLVTAVFHGVVLPLGRWSPPVWKLPAEEIASETAGHLLWIWSIDLVRRGLRRG